MGRPPLARMGAIFLRVGNLTFGGGSPTMAALHSEFVASRGWLSSEQYGLIYALARTTPGTNLLAFCAGVGWTMLGWMGAIVAVLATTLPSAAVAVFLTAGYDALRTNSGAMAAIAGIIAAAIGMMAAGAWQLLAPRLRSRGWPRAAAIFSAALVLSLAFSLTPVQILALAALTGALWTNPAEL